MDIQTVTVELLRAGPRHNQLLSPITQYLGVCGDSPASRVTLPYEHGELERRLQELRYGVDASNDSRRTSQVLEQTGREIAQILSSIDGVAGVLNPKLTRPGTLTHLRIVLSASELAMLPFEASKVPTGSNVNSVWLALRPRAPVCITRHIRSVSAEGVPWPSEPRILFIAGPDTPAREHQEALEAALHPWRDSSESVGDLLHVLDQPKVSGITRTLAAAAKEGKPFTHVHVLAHGTQIDDSDRYSAVALVLSQAEEPVSGERLATALTWVAHSGANRPAVVTLASCDSGRPGDVRATDAGVAHDLHDRGIQLVVASQFPLSVESSTPFVSRFYEGQLRGEHPLVSLYAVRLDLHSRMGDTHDWASLIVYEALPETLAAQLEAVRYWQTRRAQEGALKRLEALAQTARAAEYSDATRADLVADVDERVAEMPTSGFYALECAGLRAAAHKRIAQTSFHHAYAAGPGHQAHALLDQSRRRLSDARREYWRAARAFLTPSTESLRRKSNLHWLLGQVISLDVVLGRPLDRALLAVAQLAAEIDLESPAEDERAWAHVSLAEFALLRLSEVASQEQERKTCANEVLQHARAFLDLVGPLSEHVDTTSRQFERYVTWWGNLALQWLLTELGVPERPHWHFDFGLVPTAERVVELLLGGRGRRTPSTPAIVAPPSPLQKDAASPAAPPLNLAPAAAPSAILSNTASGTSRAETAMVFSVEMLPAENGDCLFLEYGDRAQTSRVLIDCGAKSTVPAIAGRLGGPGSASAHPFELFVLTHIDADHINGVLSLFDHPNLTLRFQDIWFNGWRQIGRFLSVQQAEDFSRLLEEPKRNLPWNRAFSVEGGKYPSPVVVADGSAPPTVTLPKGMQLTVLSPGPRQLSRLAKEWRRVLLELDPKKAMLGRRRPPPPVEDFARFDLKSLATLPANADSSVANGSSIALLAEFAGRSVLLAGDAHADVLVHSIRALQRSRGREGERLRVDALKLSHHGSANATTIPLLGAIDCQHYLISSNGNIFYHPDREAIARVIVHGGRQPTLHFNYRSHYNDLWDSAGLKRKYGYDARYPLDSAAGLRFNLAN